MESRCYYIYILLCCNGHYYTGITTNLLRRYEEHVLGTDKCKYTRSFKPLRIAQSWQIHDEKSLALKIEKFIKKLSRQEKEQLIAYPERLVQLFDCVKSRVLTHK